MVSEAREAADQAYDAAGLLLSHGFSRREYRAAARELERWPREDSAESEERGDSTDGES
jgi:hypothetical protein